jgi:UDP-glucose 4-epimerase
LNLINYSIANQVEKFVFASSMSVYGNQDLDSVHEGMNAKPLSCYGVSKLASEGYLRVFQHKLPFVIFRMFNVYGPGQDMANLSQGMVSIYLSQAIRNKRIIIKGSYERFRDFIYIDDVVDSWFDVSTNHEVKNVTLNLGTGVKTTVRDLIEMIKSLLPDLEIKIEAGTDGDQFGLFSNNTLYSSLIGVNDFTPLNIGLREFIIWAKQELN